VEALPCVKCAIRHDLLFREQAPSSIVEEEETGDQELEDVGAGGDSGESEIEVFSWDGLLTEDEDEEPMYSFV